MSADLASDFTQPLPAHLHYSPTARRLASWTSRLLETVAAALVLVVLANVLLGIVTRYVFNAPISWTEELGLFAFLWLIFIGAAAEFSRGAHIAFESLLDPLPHRLGAVTRFLLDVIVPAGRTPRASRCRKRGPLGL